MTMRRIDHSAVGDSLWSAELPNGLAVRVVPRPGFRKKCAMLAVNYGAAALKYTLGGRTYETPAGTAHFLEHKMFEQPDGNLLDRLTARGAYANAYTGAGMTAYHFECGQDFYENLELLLGSAFTTGFTDESVERERGIITQEILMYDDEPGFRLYRAAMEALFARHPIREGVAGTVESIAAITADMLREVHGAFYVPSNMALCVVGDVEPERIEEIALRLTPGALAAHAVPDYGEPETVEIASERTSLRMDVSEPMFSCAAKLAVALPNDASVQRLSAAARLVMKYVMGASSEFYTALYAEGLLRSDFFAQAEPEADTLVFECGGSSSRPEEVYERLCEKLRECARDGFDAAELERLRRSIYGARLRALCDPEGLCSSLAVAAFGGFDYYDGFALGERVSADDCVEFVRERLRPERIALTVIEPLTAK